MADRMQLVQVTENERPLTEPTQADPVEPGGAASTPSSGVGDGGVDAPTGPVAPSDAAGSAASGMEQAASEEPLVEVGPGSTDVSVDTFAAWIPTLDPQAAADIIVKGGPIVMILIALSIVATTVIVMKLVQFVWLGVGSKSATERALQHWIAGREDDALTEVDRSRSPAAVALAHGLRGQCSGLQESVVREDTERVALENLSNLRSNMRVLEATVQIAPLLGLFGTVIGMISAFQALQSAGSEADPAVLAGGIWVALMTTAVGLAVAIPVAFCNYWLEGRIDRERDNTEAALTSLFTRRATAPEAGKERDRLHVVPAAE